VPDAPLRTAVVTGASRGIGEAVARALAREGIAVLLAGRSADRLAAVAAGITGAGGEAWPAPCDVTDEAAVAALAETAAHRLGEVDVLVNNAGAASGAPLARTTLDEWNRLFAVNATGAFLCTRAFLPPMMERGRGRVVNVASVAGLRGARYIAAYAAAKHALIGLTRVAAAESARTGVTVNAVCPGYVDTDMTRETLAAISRRTGMSDDEARAALLARSPQQRLVTPEEVAAAVVYLCGPAARAITGDTLVLDGGELNA
jgi:3-hydroxybutyrate dehydrogenase